MTATPIQVVVVTIVVIGGVWGETFIPSLRDTGEVDDTPIATTFDPFVFPEYTTVDPILLDTSEVDSNPPPSDPVPAPVAAPTLSVRKIPSLSSIFRVRPAFASRKSSVHSLRPRKLSPAPVPASVSARAPAPVSTRVPAPVPTPRIISPVRFPSSREIVVFNSRKIPTLDDAHEVPTARKMPSLSSRKNSALVSTSRERLVADYSPVSTSRKLPTFTTRKAPSPVSTPRENPTLSILRIRPVPSSILRNRQEPSSLSPSLVEISEPPPVEISKPSPSSPTIIQRPTPALLPPVTRRPIPTKSSSPSPPIIVKRPIPVPSSPILIKRPSPPDSPSRVYIQRPTPAPALSNVRLKRPGPSPSSSSSEKSPNPLFRKRLTPSPATPSFAKSLDASPAPVQATPETYKVRFPSLPTLPKRPISYRTTTTTESPTTTIPPTTTLAKPDGPAPSGVKNGPLKSPSWPDDSLTIVRSSIERTTTSPISDPKNNPITSPPSSKNSSENAPSFPSPLKRPSSLTSSPAARLSAAPMPLLSAAPMPLLSASRSSLSPPVNQTSRLVSFGPRNRFLVMPKRKQEAKENNLIGKSPCPRGTDGQACRRRLAISSRTCSSGSCQKCRRGCSTLEPSEWTSCCRDHLLCCRHLAASCRRCDQPQLFPFCSAAFKKCI